MENILLKFICSRVTTKLYQAKSETSLSRANLKIFQAGNTFGYMKYNQGFGSRESKFFIWMKK
jgi:hypothetical protein